MRKQSLGCIKVCMLLAMLALAALPILAAAAPLRQEDDPLLHADMHLDAGLKYVWAGDRAAAIQEFEKALSHYRVLNNQIGEAYALIALAQTEFYSGQPTSALIHFEAALQLYQGLNKPDFVKRSQEGLADALTAVAAEKAAAGQYDQALGDLGKALELYGVIGDQGRTAFVLNEIGTVQKAAARYPEAEASLRQALDMCRAAQDRETEIIVLNNLGEVYDDLGRYADALAQQRLAQELCAALAGCASTSFAVDFLANIGRIYSNVADYDNALDALQKALGQAEVLGDRKRQVIILNSLGVTYIRLARYGEARTQLQTAQNLVQSIQFPEGLEATHINIGELFQQTGRAQEALREYQTARELAAQIPDLEGEATVLGNVATVYEDLGQYEEAIRGNQAALEIWQRLGSIDGQAVAHNALGVIMTRLGQFEAAEQHYQTAADLRMQAGNAYGIAVSASNLADLYFQLGRYDKALQQATRARDQAHSIDTPALEAVALDNMGAAEAALGENEAALSSHQAALAIRQSIGDRPGEAASRANLAAMYSDQKRYPEALAQYEMALDIFREIGQVENQAQALANVGRVYRRQGNLAQTVRSYRTAVDLSESVQGKIKVEELATSFAAGHAWMYSGLIDALAATGAAETTFDYAERARARAFLDQLGNQQVDFRRGAQPELINQEQEVRQRVIGLQSALDAEHARPLGQQTQTSLDELSADLEHARKEYQELLTRLKLASPEYASLISVSTLSLEEVQSQVLDEDTTLIEYFILDDQTLAWVIDREGFELVRLDIARDELANQVKFLRKLIDRRDFDAQASAALYDALFAPLAPHIDHANLIIVPHGVLHYLPFAALWNAGAGRYLIENYGLTYAPSASALKYILDKRNPDEGRVLALGDPEGSLPKARNEATAIAALYGAAPLLGPQAMESRVRAAAGQLDELHLAAHGVYNPYNSLFTRIELAAGEGQDGNLEVHEVYGLDLTAANLVVLSACETALGEQSAGDELVGLTRAFLYAGAPAVVTTLWSIDDAASGALMEAFYGHLREGLTNAEALRAAQLEVLAQEQWQTPYYWAAFSLTGDYRGNGESRMAVESALGPAEASAATSTVTVAPTVAPTAAAGPTPGHAGGGLCSGSAALPLGLATLVGLQRLRIRRRTRS